MESQISCLTPSLPTLKLTHVVAHIGTEGNELADRMAMLAVQLKEKRLRLYQEEMDISTLLKMRAGE